VPEAEMLPFFPESLFSFCNQGTHLAAYPFT